MLTGSTQPYWDKAAETYDQVFTHTLIGRAEREAVWQELGRIFHSGQRILELNCGTGVDAAHLAESGVRVLACDIAPRMIEVARQRVSSTGLGQLIDFRVLPTEEIAALGNEGPFDGAFSNFAGLNHVEDLSAVARYLAHLLKPGARVLLCMLGRVAPWEIAWYLAHGHPAKAIERFKRDGTIHRHPDKVTLKAHYPSVGAIVRMFTPEFRLREWKGIGVILPPPYMESWARRFPKVLDRLASTDRWLGRFPVLRGMAGHILFHFERVGR
jgi:2-polyprenyl-3-methyl-5-hydroxy-6-metoxy-1,4-benzoquinol methylase